MEPEKVLESIEVIRRGMPSSLEEFKSMGLARDGIYKRLEFAIGLVLEGLAEMAREQGIMAISYGDVVASLKERSLIPGDVAEKAAFLAQLREVLIYDYDLVNDEIAFRDMGEYLQFIEDVMAHLEGYG
ncbi:hypothetical protein A3L11_06470 [Thermococcus siculi]|uniref:DUF86 domain-containing protein n=1 Tax=Thermococcus siculi TaxID=72803 RepID=A0A2Z2MSX1_9EURY|nr:hypothetical protein A3L11_06470 [Thermococcus siculi]